MTVDLDRQLRQYAQHLDEAQGALSFEDILERSGEVQVIPGRITQQPSPRRSWVAVAVAALVVLIVAIGIRLFPGTGGDTEPIDQPTTTTWPGPVHTDAASLGINTMEEDTIEDGGEESWSWEDPEDSAIPYVDIIGVRAERGRWQIRLSGWPAPVEAIPEGATISHGMVVETNGDDVADYVLGIDWRAPEGPYHVWITDLATGEPLEQDGPPYGIPFDFSHPGEPGNFPPTLSLFPVGAAPPDVFTVRANRFYAWASLTVDGEVVAWDYAPNASWLSIPPAEQTPRPPAPEMEPGARVLIIPVQNMSGETAEMFVALDTSPMETLVGTAVPGTIEPGLTADVTFTVPEGEEWAIFLNPRPGLGASITAQDIPADASGELPVTIFVGPEGSAGVQVADDLGPGWFGS